MACDYPPGQTPLCLALVALPFTEYSRVRATMYHALSNHRPMCYRVTLEESEK